jgi:large subunit ribosomal protein L15
MKFAKERRKAKRVKMRGRKTAGWGSKKKRRNAGSRGGVGFCGMFDHKAVWRIKYDPNRIGKHGFKSLKKRAIKADIKAINLRDINRLTDKAEIDLTNFGFEKVLAGGTLTRPITIKAKAFSEKAIKKIEASGGKAVKI